MRIYQDKILNLVLSGVELPEYLWAFERGRSIPEMAALHVNKTVVVSFDIKDFFGSITQKMISRVLEGYNISGSAARTVSELCTYKYFVPQGAITSPKISNIIAANTFGPDISSYCTDNNLVMSIYADDITISSDEVLDNEKISEIKLTIRSIIANYNFEVNHRKTKVMFRNRRQWVCGAVVNDKVNLIRSERNRLRAVVHNITRNGIEVEASKNDVSVEMFVSRVKGRLNWFRQLNFEKGNLLLTKLNDYLSGEQHESSETGGGS